MTAPCTTAPGFLVAVSGLMLAEIGRVFEGFLADRAYIALVTAVHILFVDLYKYESRQYASYHRITGGTIGAPSENLVFSRLL